MLSYDENCNQAGAQPDIFIWGATGGASFAIRGAVNGLCKTFRKRPEKFGGATGGSGEIWGSSPLGTPLAPPLYPHKTREEIEEPNDSN